MIDVTFRLVLAAHLAVLVVLLARRRTARRTRRNPLLVCPSTVAAAAAEDPRVLGAHLRAVADRMFDEADLLLVEAEDRRLLGLDGDAAELRDRAAEVEAVTYLVIEEARRLMGERPPRWPSRDDEPAS